MAMIGRQSFIETFGHLYRPDDLASFLESHSEDRWREQLVNADVAVRLAEVDGEAIGFAKLSSLTLPVSPDGPAAELGQLYVLKPWHGLGVAADLMQWALDEARNRKAEYLYLSVFSENHRARRFYDRYGFQFVQPYAFMVGNQADEDHILCLDLRADLEPG